MKNRKQLPCFGYLKDRQVDIVALTTYLLDNGLLEVDRYNDIRASANTTMKNYISISEHTYNHYFKGQDEDGLESLKFRQLMLTEFDQSKATGSDDVEPVMFFSRFRRRDPDKKGYNPHADELNYGKRNELCVGEIAKTMDLFESQITRARLTYLVAGHDIKPHVDYDPSYTTRYHIPIITHPDVLMHMERKGQHYCMHMPANGNIYFFNTGIKHWVTNNSPIDRLHLVIDVHGQSELEGLISLDEQYATVDE